MDPRAALPDDDRPGRNQLRIVSLDPESLATTVATIAGASSAFLVCHDLLSDLSDYAVEMPVTLSSV
jgi:hypothetical protein